MVSSSLSSSSSSSCYQRSLTTHSNSIVYFLCFSHQSIFHPIPTAHNFFLKPPSLTLSLPTTTHISSYMKVKVKIKKYILTQILSYFYINTFFFSLQHLSHTQIHLYNITSLYIMFFFLFLTLSLSLSIFIFT